MTIKWTKEELEVLREHVDSTLNKLKDLIPEKTEEQIIDKLNREYRKNTLNLWTDEEVQIIKSNKDTPVFNLMKLLPNRSYSAIQYKKYTVCGPDGKRKTFSKEEIAKLKFLKNEGYTNYEIAEILGRPMNSVLGKLYTLDCVLKRNHDIYYWTDEKTKLLEESIIKGVTLENLCEYFNVSSIQLINKARTMGFLLTEIATENKLRVDEKKEEKKRELVNLINENTKVRQYLSKERTFLKEEKKNLVRYARKVVRYKDAFAKFLKSNKKVIKNKNWKSKEEILLFIEGIEEILNEYKR